VSKFVLPTQDGANVITDPTRVPVSVRVYGMDPSLQATQTLLRDNWGAIQQFYLRNAQNASLSGLPQIRTVFALSDSLRLSYNKQGPLEYLELRPTPPTPTKGVPPEEKFKEDDQLFVLELFSFGYITDQSIEEAPTSFYRFDNDDRVFREPVSGRDYSNTYAKPLADDNGNYYVFPNLSRPYRVWFGDASSIGLDTGVYQNDNGEILKRRNTIGANFYTLGVGRRQIVVNNTVFTYKGDLPEEYFECDLFANGAAIYLSGTTLFQSLHIHRVLLDSETFTYTLEEVVLVEGWSAVNLFFDSGMCVAKTFVHDVNDSGTECFICAWDLTLATDTNPLRTPEWRSRYKRFVFTISSDGVQQAEEEFVVLPYTTIHTDLPSDFYATYSGTWVGDPLNNNGIFKVDAKHTSVISVGAASGTIQNVYLDAYYLGDEFHTVSLAYEYFSEGYTIQCEQSSDPISGPNGSTVLVVTSEISRTPCSSRETIQIKFSDPRYDEIVINNSIDKSKFSAARGGTEGLAQGLTNITACSHSASSTYDITKIAFGRLELKLGLLEYILVRDERSYSTSSTQSGSYTYNKSSASTQVLPNGTVVRKQATVEQGSQTYWVEAYAAAAPNPLSCDSLAFYPDICLTASVFGYVAQTFNEVGNNRGDSGFPFYRTDIPFFAAEVSYSAEAAAAGAVSARGYTILPSAPEELIGVFLLPIDGNMRFIKSESYAMFSSNRGSAYAIGEFPNDVFSEYGFDPLEDPAAPVNKGFSGSELEMGGLPIGPFGRVVTLKYPEGLVAFPDAGPRGLIPFV
jgi:hypothetical protein